MSTESEVLSKARDAASSVVDPEIGLTLGELNLIREVRMEEGKIVVEFVATTPFCPLAEVLAMMIRDAVKEATGGGNIMVFIRKHINEEVINERINKD